MMSKPVRLLLAAAALLLVGAFVFPLWRIALIAPQYPEGLGLLIRVNTVTGVEPQDLQNINGLNHYIGMKAIEPDSIPELTLMPIALGALLLSGLAVAVLGRRALARAWVAIFFIGSLAGLADFWYWQYDYGHNLDVENAPIKVPGMSYQPPLFGSKQLLNFTATSWPALGGLAAFGSLALAAGALLVDARTRRATSSSPTPLATAAVTTSPLGTTEGVR
jgi:copper chaperone NosL